MDQPKADRPEDWGLKNTELIQRTAIFLEGENDEGEKVQVLLASNRRILPIPYSEEP